MAIANVLQSLGRGFLRLVAYMLLAFAAFSFALGLTRIHIEGFFSIMALGNLVVALWMLALSVMFLGAEMVASKQKVSVWGRIPPPRLALIIACSCFALSSALALAATMKAPMLGPFVALLGSALMMLILLQKLFHGGITSAAAH